jgi:hypothetical protein
MVKSIDNRQSCRKSSWFKHQFVIPLCHPNYLPGVKPRHRHLACVEEDVVMREYVRFQSRHLLNGIIGDWSPLHFVGHLVHNLHARHIAQELATQDSHMLSDIGLLRGDVEHAAHLPITHDAMVELENAHFHHLEDVEAILQQDGDGLAHTNLRSIL